MLFTLVLTCLAALGLTTVALVIAGHRLRYANFWLSLAAAVGLAITSGELAARAFLLPTDHIVLAQAILVGAGGAVGWWRRSWNPIGVVFFAALLAAAGSYLLLAVYVTARGQLSVLAIAASLVVLILEVVALALAASFAFETCDVACRVRDDRPVPLPDPGHRPFVSLHVAAYNEPPDMLIETIQSLQALDYPNFEIVVIDNNTSDEDVWRPVEAFCAGHERVTFVHVAPWPGFKSGALNLALAQYTDPRAEVIGIVDADYLVKPDYLQRTVGYFADQNRAFVQTPQDYREWEGDRYLTACYDAYKYFFASSMQSRNQRNSIIFGGTMGLIRRDVLVDLGGWDEWCITEDAEVSLRMLRAGHSGLYLNESFGHGIMPLTFGALKRQRFRWCFGGIQILRKHWRSLMPWDRSSVNRLSLSQRADYFIGGLQWFTDFITVGFTIVLAISASLVVFGQPLQFRPLAGAALLLPVAIAASGLLRAVWALRHLTGISRRRALLAFANWMALSWTVGLACARGLVRKDGVFLVTPKWRASRGFVAALRETRTESALAAGLWSGAATLVTIGRGGSVLPGLALWQGGVYAAAPVMAWMNQHSELSTRLERRRRTEERRDRLAVIQPHVARVGVGIAALGLVALFVVGGATAGDQSEVLEVPRRSADDAGPLGNLGVLPNVENPDPLDERAPTVTTTPGASPGTVVATTVTSPSASTPPAVPTTTTPLTSPPTSATPPTSRTPTSGSPPTSASPAGPPSSRPGRP